MCGLAIVEPGLPHNTADQEAGHGGRLGTREYAFEIPDAPFTVSTEDNDATAARAPGAVENLFTSVGGAREGGVEVAEPGIGVGVEDANGALVVGHQQVVPA